MRSVLKWLTYTVGVILLLILLAYVTGYGYLVRGVRLTYLKGYKSANIYDGRDFDTREIAKSNEVSLLPKAYNYNRIELPAALQEMLNRTKTTSFLVLKNDSIVWEHYYLGHSDSTLSNAFSMAKTVVTMLVEMAIEEGKIKGWNEKVRTFLPWLEGEYANELTLEHLSKMCAGLDWSESYFNPFGITARAYYDNDILATMHRVKVVSKPGVEYHYQSGATQLLGFCLKKAIGMNIADYAAEKIWKPLGMESAATWHTDKENGMELTYCCINAVTRDYARIGRMLEHSGHAESKMIDSAFLAGATAPGLAPFYGQSFWLSHTHGLRMFQMQGTMGQFVIVIPDAHLVIVRTGNIYLNQKAGIPICSQLYADESVAAWAGDK